MGTASFSFFERHLTAPRRIYGLSAALSLTGGRGVSPLVAARSPVASARVGLGSALHSALTPMTPHERDPFVERSKGDNTRTGRGRG